ncbi:MAG: hypothetical protein ACOYMN_08585 [Roseimicrobium sp.]
MPSPDLPQSSTSSKETLTFGQRYAFLIVGFFVIIIFTGALILGWLSCSANDAFRKVTQQAGLQADPVSGLTFDNKGTIKLSEMVITTRKALPASTAPREDAQVWQPMAITPAEESAAQELLAQFWSAKSWREKAAFVRDDARVAPLMQTYYEVQKRREPRAGGFQRSAAYLVPPFEVQHLVYDSDIPQRPLELALIKAADGTFKLDWESYTGVGEITWEAFQKEQSVKPVLLRGYGVPDNYFNFEFVNRNQFVCLKLVSSDFENILYAYTERDSPTGRAISGEGETASLHPVAVKVAFPPNPQSSNCVRLVELVANRWLLLDAQQ